MASSASVAGVGIDPQREDWSREMPISESVFARFSSGDHVASLSMISR